MRKSSKSTTKNNQSSDEFSDIMKEKEENFKVALKIFKYNKTLESSELIDQVEQSMCNVDFFKKSCPESIPLTQFVRTCCSMLMYEEYQNGNPIFHLGEDGNRFYIILSGIAGIFIPKDQQRIEKEEEEQASAIKRLTVINDFSDEVVDLPFKEKMKKIINKNCPNPKEKELQLMLLESGKINQYFTSKYVCRYQLIASLFPGNFFGEMALTTDKPRGASIFALSDLKLVSLSKSNYKKVFERQIQSMNFKIDTFLSLFPKVTRFKMSKYVLFFRELNIGAGLYLWRQNDEANSLNYIVDNFIRGSVQLEKEVEEISHQVSTKEKIIGFQKKDHKEKLQVSFITSGSFLGEIETFYKLKQRIYSVKTIEPCKLFSISSDVENNFFFYYQDFNLNSKAYPEIMQSIKEICLKNDNWIKSRLETLTEVKKNDPFKQEIQQDVYYERLKVDELEKKFKICSSSKVPLKTSQSTSIRSIIDLNRTKRDVVNQNTQLLQQLENIQSSKGIDKEFNLLKMASDTIQKSLQIRVNKRHENFQPAKPKGQTPYYSSANKTRVEMIRSVSKQYKTWKDPYEKAQFTQPFQITQTHINTNEENLTELKNEISHSSFNFNRIINPALQIKTKEQCLTRQKNYVNCKSLTDSEQIHFPLEKDDFVRPLPVIHASNYLIPKQKRHYQSLANFNMVKKPSPSSSNTNMVLFSKTFFSNDFSEKVIKHYQ